VGCGAAIAPFWWQNWTRRYRFGNCRPRSENSTPSPRWVSVSGVVAARLTVIRVYVQMDMMNPSRLRNALKALGNAMDEVNAALGEMSTEPDPLALHIFASRRHYRAVEDSKSGRRRETTARLSYHPACDLGFRGSFDEWERLMGASCRR
jgi:hypothetical protein